MYNFHSKVNTKSKQTEINNTNTVKVLYVDPKIRAFGMFQVNPLISPLLILSVILRNPNSVSPNILRDIEQCKTISM